MGEVRRGFGRFTREYFPELVELVPLKDHGDLLQQMRTALGLYGRESHLRIHAVARYVDLANWFGGHNKLLSKLLHSTAFSIVLDLDEAGEVQLLGKTKVLHME